MLAAEAMRLAAVEALCPTAAIASGTGFPTLAGHRVYDSQMIGIEGLDPAERYTPSLALFTDGVQIDRRGSGAPSATGQATARLVVIVELSSAQVIPEHGQGVMPFAEDDPRARLVLAALAAQVRKTLLQTPAGSAFRAVAGACEEMRIEPFALPQFDFRWMRSTMTFSFLIKDDCFTDAPGLPEPIRSLLTILPEGSYALAKLAELDAIFDATERVPLEGIRLSTVGDPAAALPDAAVP